MTKKLAELAEALECALAHFLEDPATYGSPKFGKMMEQYKDLFREERAYYFVERSLEHGRPWRAGFSLPSGDEVTWKLRFETSEAAREHCRMAGRERYDNTENWPIVTRTTEAP